MLIILEPWFFLFSRYNPNITILRFSDSPISPEITLLTLRNPDHPTLGLVILEGSTESNSSRGNLRQGEIFSIITIHSKYDVQKRDYTLDSNIDPAVFRGRKLKRAPISRETIDTDEEDIESVDDSVSDLEVGHDFGRLSLTPSQTPWARTKVLDLGKLYAYVFDDTSSIYKTGDPVGGELFVSLYLRQLCAALKERNETPSTGAQTL